ncbi:T9SS type A sorting domain-containing protein [bacterium]|nr:T9SS type A sorting domain-containing protein [bacterium]
MRGPTMLLFAATIFAATLAPAGDYTVGETTVTRLSPEERDAMLGGLFLPEGDVAVRAYAPLDELPAALDWRDMPGGSYVSGVRWQGSCGSCWAFASLAAFESTVMIVRDEPDTDLDLSEQYILSCNWSAGSCLGGWLEGAFEFLRLAGTPPEGCFAYLGDDTVPCRESCHATLDLVEKVDQWWFVTGGTADELAIKTALQTGPVSAAFAIHDNFMGYTGGVYDAYGSPDTGEGHTVLVVGYDDAQQCWIAKNSWGTGWGEDGFCRVAYDSGCHFADYSLACSYDPAWTPSVVWEPAEIVPGEPVTLTYDASGRPLAGAGGLIVHWGHDDWQGIVDTPLTHLGGNLWTATLIPPAWASSLEFVFTDGQGTWDNNGGADWIVPLFGSEPAFTMDGLLDPTAALVASGEDLELWSAVSGPLLYLAVRDLATPRRHDLFALVATDTLSMRPAPWTKSGMTVGWSWFLATEVDNNWSGWFDALEVVQDGAFFRRANGEVLEGVLDLGALLPGRSVLDLWLAAAAYETWSGGALQRQAPDGDGDGVLTPSEMVADAIVPLEIARLEATRDEGGVTLAWETAAPAAAGDFVLTAASGGAGWHLAVESRDAHRFRALDRSSAACGRAAVTYSLHGRRADGGLVLLDRRELGALSPASLRVAPIRPNPANPGLEIAFVTDVPGRVSVRVLDARGRLVATLLDASRGAGDHAARWDGATDAGAHAPSGVYFVQVRCGESVETRKLTLAR